MTNGSRLHGFRLIYGTDSLDGGTGFSNHSAHSLNSLGGGSSQPANKLGDCKLRDSFEAFCRRTPNILLNLAPCFFFLLFLLFYVLICGHGKDSECLGIHIIRWWRKEGAQGIITWSFIGSELLPSQLPDGALLGRPQASGNVWVLTGIWICREG